MLALALALAQPAGFTCSAQGAKLLVPATAPEVACARLKAGLGKAGIRFDRGEIRVALRFEKPGIATASVTRTSGGKAVRLPDISVATSDRAMGPSTIDLLAREIAGRLTTR
ncbi:hypothetical protein P6144_17125 [Sphingomonas sp. HITSZ_GF]|uniref:hypothetical protein n=1 Tax=Sphingomonas sp. HITSZ_GF TaxID=3037247 RepID=UPI00240DE9E4|nr:hypothetical protein [Sphingomonas sp. HITSZ_GF]MDG2535386.1 hypothetical protein [Sphingomonas sp. HITSZ_GF]